MVFVGAQPLPPGSLAPSLPEIQSLKYGPSEKSGWVRKLRSKLRGVGRHYPERCILATYRKQA